MCERPRNAVREVIHADAAVADRMSREERQRVVFAGRAAHEVERLPGRAPDRGERRRADRGDVPNASLGRPEPERLLLRHLATEPGRERERVRWTPRSRAVKKRPAEIESHARSRIDHDERAYVYVPRAAEEADIPDRIVLTIRRPSRTLHTHES